MTYKSRTADKFVVRLPDGMRDRIAQAAKESGRSMNSEFVGRLSASFNRDDEWRIMVDTNRLLQDHLKRATEENDRLRAEVEALRKDAERLDWLIEQGNVGGLVQEGTHGFWMAWLEEHDSGRHKYQDGHYATGRKAIDAAMAAKEGK